MNVLYVQSYQCKFLFYYLFINIFHENIIVTLPKTLGNSQLFESPNILLYIQEYHWVRLSKNIQSLLYSISTEIEDILTYTCRAGAILSSLKIFNKQAYYCRESHLAVQKHELLHIFLSHHVQSSWSTRKVIKYNTRLLLLTRYPTTMQHSINRWSSVFHKYNGTTNLIVNYHQLHVYDQETVTNHYT